MDDFYDFQKTCHDIQCILAEILNLINDIILFMLNIGNSPVYCEYIIKNENQYMDRYCVIDVRDMNI